MGRKACSATAALCLGMAATPALAQTAREAELEARLAQLEAAVTQLRTELAITRAAPAPDTEKRLATLEARPKDGFLVGNTSIRIGGFVRVNMSATRYNDGEAAVGGLGKEFHLAQQIPVGGGFSSQDFLIHARQTRFVLNTATPAGDKELKSHIEFDFALSTAPAGAQRATNPFVPTFRRGFITYGNLLVGQEWSTFQNVAVLPETTDFVGPLEGTVFVRQGIVQYKVPLSNGVNLLLALENPQTEVLNSLSPTLIDNDDDRLPDMVARLNAKTGLGDFSVAGLIRELRMDNSGWGDTALGWGISAAGRIPFGGRHDLRFMASYGDGIGRYLGLGFAPDAIFAGVPGARLETVRNFAGFAALKLGWSATLRSTFMVGYQTADYGDSVVSLLANKSAWSAAGNLFWTAARNFDVGLEYRHGERRLLNRESGSTDRLEAAFKYAY